MKGRITFRLWIVFSIFAFIFAAIFYFFAQKNFPLSVRILRALLFLIFLLPAIFMTSLLVGASYNAESRTAKYDRMHDFRQILYFSIFFTAVLTFVNEIAKPLIDKKIDIINDSPEIVAAYIESAKIMKARGQKEAAVAFLDEALKKDAKNESAKSLLHSLSLQGDVKEKEKAQKNRPSFPEDVFSLVKKARFAFEKNNFVDAHHYSSLSLKSALPSKEIEAEMKSVREKSWSELLSTKNDEGINADYAQKIKGYLFYIRGEYLRAYEIFTKLSRKSASLEEDADVKDYLALCKEKLGERYFFDEEILPLPAMDFSENVHFMAQNEDGSFDVVHIKKTVDSLGTQDAEFLIGLSVFTFDSNRKYKQGFYSEKAKLTKLKNDSGILSTNAVKNNSLLFVCSVNKDCSLQKPVFKGGYDKNIEEYKILNVRMSDFKVVKDAMKGEKNMSLLSLWKFAFIAKKYGFSEEIVLQNLIKRILSPAFLLSLFILSAAVGTSYRLKKRIDFQLGWTLSISFMLCFLCVAFYEFSPLYGMFFLSLISLFGGKMVFFIAVSAHILLLFGVSTNFLIKNAEE